ncbi:MAG: competence/damage-inducible protein A [Microvirga sp.]
MTSERIWTAGLLVIGDEILSGRTQDRNVAQVATWRNLQGIRLSEVRVVPDDLGRIGAAVNALRAAYDYLFTTGGIGPTHDDITADAIAKAFGVPIGIDERARAMMLERYKPEDLNEARLRMARIPHGADLVDNPISRAPGFKLGNVIVMAGVPSIMQAMLDAVAPTLSTGARMQVEAIDAAGVPEGIYAEGLGAIAKAHDGVTIGSYPSFSAAGFKNQIVVRGKDAAAVAGAVRAVEDLLERLRAERAPA